MTISQPPVRSAGHGSVRPQESRDQVSEAQGPMGREQGTGNKEKRRHPGGMAAGFAIYRLFTKAFHNSLDNAKNIDLLFWTRIK
jgi:hypothetical protein